MQIKDLIKSRRIEMNYTMKELAEKVGVSEGTISRWESGDISNMRRDKIVNLAKTLRISPAAIMEWDEQDPEPRSDAVRIPVLGRVAAGIPFDAVEEVIDYEEISSEMARDGDYFGLRIQGDSMEPKISNGDVVIVRKQEDADDGDLVIAIVNGYEGCCKRLRKYADGTIGLISTNPSYAPMFFTASEVGEKPIRIVGIVKELRAKF